MRRLPAGVAVSVAVHAAVVAIAVSADAPPPLPAPDAAPHVELVPPAPATTPSNAPIEVTFLNGDRPHSRTPPDANFDANGDRPLLSHPPAVAIAPGAANGDRPRFRTPPDADFDANGDRPHLSHPDAGEPAAPGRNPLFDMRRGTPSLQALGVGRATDYGAALDEVAPPGTGAKPDVPATGQLHPDGGGTYRHDEGVFHATIASDGSVTMRDGRNLRVHVPLAHPRALVRGIGRSIAAWYADDSKPVGTLGRVDGPRPAERVNLNEAVPGAPTITGRGGATEHGIDPSEAPVPILSGGFDLTDGLMRRHGIDPYASRKLAFLDSTRDERVAIGQRHRAEQREQAARIMKQNLERLAATVLDPIARKRALFDLWDECIETGGEADVAAGAASRKLVVGFIRAHHPAGTPAAYTREELAALNARKQSRAVFAPYD